MRNDVQNLNQFVVFEARPQAEFAVLMTAKRSLLAFTAFLGKSVTGLAAG
jgi:hypothetical protein